MTRKLRAVITAVAVCLLLSSCTGFNPMTEDLMKPPRLTAEQKEIDDALHDSVLSSDISFKYPKNGAYRSAFVFHDIDGDGEEEAIVFYAVDFNDFTRIAILDRENGVWTSTYDVAGAARDVEFITFANVSGRSTSDIIIGWSNPDRNDNDKLLAVYSYYDRQLHSELDLNQENTAYHSYFIEDLDENGLDDIFLLTNSGDGSSAESPWIKLILFDGFNVTTVSKLPLSEKIQDFAGVTAGRIKPDKKQRGIYVDEMLTSDLMATEVFTMVDGRLSAVISYDMVNNSQPLSTGDANQVYEPVMKLPTLYDRTRRATATTVCADINGDGVIEIPTMRLLPGYSEEKINELEPIYLTEYSQIKDDAFERVFACVINQSSQSGGYRIAFPEEWIGKVTVVNQIENGEWQFIRYKEPENKKKNPLDDVSGELARIRVVSQSAYQDKFLDSYSKLETRGMFTYYGYVPPDNKDPLAISISELQYKLFSLI